MKDESKKFLLAEKEIPEAWYNVVVDMPVKPPLSCCAGGWTRKTSII